MKTIMKIKEAAILILSEKNNLTSKEIYSEILSKGIILTLTVKAR